MAVAPLPNFDIAGIETTKQGLSLIHHNIELLKKEAAAANFANREDRVAFCNNIDFLKQYYERVERLHMEGK